MNGANTIMTVNSSGDYRLSYCVRTTAALLMGTRLVINGAALNQTSISPVLSESNFCRSTIVSLAAGSTISLQMYGLLGAATLQNPGGAELVVERLGAGLN